MKKALYIIALMLLSTGLRAQAIYTFECVTNGGLTGDSCDICPNSIVQSRSFNGLLIYQDSVPWKWIDQPYSVRVKPGNIVEYWEHGANPYSERVSISLGLTNFFTTVGMADSTFCNGTTPPDRRPLFAASDSINVGLIHRNDTLTIVGLEPIYVVFDPLLNKYVISIDTTGFISGGGGSSLWTDAGAFTYLTATGDRGLIGASTELNSAYRWQVKDGAFVQGVGTTSSTFAAEFHNSTGTSNILMLRNDGRVGIGNNSPARTLHVTGEVRITDLTTDASTGVVGADNDGDLGLLGLTGMSVIAGSLTANDVSASNELQNFVHTSNSTSHTATINQSGGSLQLVEGAGIILTTTGTGLDGIVTIASIISQYTDEQAQDAVGNILTDGSIIDFTYNDAGNTITATVINNSIGNAQIRQGAAKSVIGVAGNATANVADIPASAADQVLVVNGANTAVSWATVNTGGITNDAVTYGKLQNIAANNVVLGNITGTNQNAQELTAANLQTLLGLSGTINRFALWTSATAIGSDAAFTFDGTNDRMTINATAAGTGANNAWLNLNGGSISGTTEAFRGSANISGLFTGIMANASNSSSGAASLEVSVGGTSAGDPFFKTTVTSGKGMVFGSDNSATNDPVRLTPDGTAPGSTADKGMTWTTDANTLVGINKDAPVYELDVSGTNGRARANQFIGVNGKWSAGNIAFGTGAGTAGTPVLNGISGPSNAFQITFTTGTTPGASQTIFTATFPTSFPIGPTYTVFSSRSQTASTDIAKFVVQASSDTAITFQSVGTLPAATQYSLTFFTFGN